MVFDLMAKSYDTDDRIKRSEIIAAQIRSRIVDGHMKTALEYGCGTGLVGLRLAEAFKSLLLIDSSEGMVLQVRKKLDALNCPSVTVLCRDFIEQAPFDLHVDYIFCSLVLHHIKDIDMILSRFYGMLKEGGRLFAIDLNKDDGSFHAEHKEFDGHNGFEQPYLKERAKNAGFAEVQTETFYKGCELIHGKNTPHSLFILDAEK